MVAMFIAPILFLSVVGQSATAQAPPSEPKSQQTYQTLYITNLTQRDDANELQTDLRNMLPKSKLYYIPAQNAISISGSSEDLQLAEKILADLDKAKKVYKLSYTITETDAGKRVSTHHFSLILASGGKTDLKQGSRVPVVTGTSESGAAAQNSQVQYVDVGLNIEASLDGVRLHTKIEQSSIADEKSSVGIQDPVIRQTSLEGMSILSLGKPLVLGTLDIPGTTHQEEIEVVSELIR
jgi:type II secretory pathway component GspD/PulD (secretin)